MWDFYIDIMPHHSGISDSAAPAPAPRPDGRRLLIGAHQSIAGGIFRAFDRARQLGCTTLQVFTKNASQWHARPLSAEDIANYKTAASESTGIAPVIAHDSYLINLCGRDPVLRKRSRLAFVDELERCELLGIRYLNFHPGAHTGQGEQEGIRRIIDSLNWAHAETGGSAVKSVLETTAGQGSAIGYRFEHLRQIIDGVDMPGRMAVCIDTCHIFAAGYDLRTAEAYEETMRRFDDTVGLGRLVAIHVNDSRKPLGSRVDRHEHIGKGAIGHRGFRALMRDERLSHVPKILETPKGNDLKEDAMNLATLRRLAAGPDSSALLPWPEPVQAAGGGEKGPPRIPPPGGHGAP